MEATEALVLHTLEDGVFVLTINRPRAFNAINREVMKAVHQALDELGDARVLILTGAGEKAFIAGADIKEMEAMDPLEAQAYSRDCHALLERIENLGIPTIAAVNGYALGGGMEFSLACDLRVASENALFGFPEVTLGIIPGWGGTQRLPRLIGSGRAMELVLTGKKIKAEEAHQLGIVNRVVAKGEALNAAKALAGEISQARTAVRHAKRAVKEGLQVDLASGLFLESLLFGQCFASPDQKEGMRAFEEKRPAQFQ
ncbi:MAG: enoyl-CoA hydratase/isomerase family protein [Bacteroidota bacterium]